MAQKLRGLENKRILVVEDVELNQYLARHIMESWGCIVNVVENGQKAVEKIKTDNYDLVLMDIQMPVMDGIEATKRIRRMDDPEKASIPIIALTANAMPNEFEIYLKSGMNDCMQKPFEEPALFRVISKNIRKSNNESVAEQAPVVNAAPASGKMYDLAMVEMISGGDSTFIQKMLKLFLDTVPATLNDLRSSTKKADWLQVSKVAHKLKSTIDSMGIADISKDIRTIESNGKMNTDVNNIPSLVEKIIAVIEKVMVQVKKDHSL
ncbi:MAG: response regulator [Flavitalea sp.]